MKVEITMKDKLAVLANELASRKPVSAYEQAVLSEAKRDAPAVVAPVYPRQPSTSPWSSDPVPKEEPLGFDVNAVEGA
jgi:hypothetical protein